MTELERSIAAYATFLDEQSLARSSDHIIQSDPDEGEVIMVDIKIRETGTDRPDDEARRRKWLPYTILAAAAAIVILVAVTLFDGTEESFELDVVDSPDDVDAPAEPATPEQAVFGAESSLALADTYFAAYNSGDADAVMALFTDDATFSNNYTGGSDIDRTDVELNLVWGWAQGTTLTSPECSVVDEVPEGAVTIRCDYETHNAPGKAVDTPPVPVKTTMTVTPDGISEFRDLYGPPTHNITEIPFTTWMAANYPEDADAAGCCEGDTVEESIARGELRAQYATEWAAYLEANGCAFDDFGC